MDPCGYPEAHELRRIQGYSDYHSLIDYVKYLWKYPEYIEEAWETDDFNRNIRVVRISTGGWSGNEDIIEAMERNRMFWAMCWYSSKRGGHYVFHIPSKEAA